MPSIFLLQDQNRLLQDQNRLLQDQNRLVEMTEQPYESEALLQRLLAVHPSILAGDQFHGSEPKRRLLVRSHYERTCQTDEVNPDERLTAFLHPGGNVNQDVAILRQH